VDVLYSNTPLQSPLFSSGIGEIAGEQAKINFVVIEYVLRVAARQRRQIVTFVLE